MSICFFGTDYEKKIKCSYTEENGITIIAEYDIKDEVEPVNGIKTWTTATKFDNRDIIIADPEHHNYIMVKDAYFAGNSFRYGSIDDVETSTFKSDSYLKADSIDSLIDVAPDLSFKKMKVYCKEVINQCGSRSVTLTNSDDKTTIELNDKSEAAEALICTNNIQKLCIGDNWSRPRTERTHIDIKINGYIELLLDQKAPLEDCYKYLKELAIYLQLFRPGKFEFERIKLLIGDHYFEYCIVFDEFAYKRNNSQNSVTENLLGFLSNCYKTIPFRDGKEEIRNIPYIINHNYRCIEDSYLSCFRFIECFYKRTSSLDKSRPIVEQSLKDYPQNISIYKTIGTTDYIEEIVALRNQYVHSGFYLKNSSLEIKNHQGKLKRVVNNIDFQWLYDRTQLLYRIAIDIIFKTLLGYSNYIYK